MKMAVKIAGVTFKNPVTVASGTFWYQPEYYAIREVQRLGAITPKTVTLAARAGNSPPRIVETPSGMVNAIGIENQGVDEFITAILPGLAATGVPVIVSVMGHTPDECGLLARRLSGLGSVAAIELNLSCPNLQKRRLMAQDARLTAEAVAAAKKEADVPVIAKLSPNVTDIAEIASAAEAAGADAVALINTLAAMVIDVRTRRPVLGNVTGGLSGPAIRPVAVRMVYEVARAVRVPIIGMGGIMTADDALEMLMAGATMVAVGSAGFLDPSIPFAVIDGIEAYLREHRIEDVHGLIGSAHREGTQK